MIFSFEKYTKHMGTCNVIPPQILTKGDVIYENRSFIWRGNRNDSENGELNKREIWDSLDKYQIPPNWKSSNSHSVKILMKLAQELCLCKKYSIEISANVNVGKTPDSNIAEAPVYQTTNLSVSRKSTTQWKQSYARCKQHRHQSNRTHQRVRRIK